MDPIKAQLQKEWIGVFDGKDHGKVYHHTHLSGA